MPTRAAADRPSRRLDAVLASLRRHGVRTFEGQLEGIGTVKVTFRPVIDVEVAPERRAIEAPAQRGKEPPPPLRDELELVTEEHGPIDANGVS